MLAMISTPREVSNYKILMVSFFGLICFLCLLAYIIGRIFTILGWSTWLAGRAAGLTTGLLKTLRGTYSHVQYLECMKSNSALRKLFWSLILMLSCPNRHPPGAQNSFRPLSH